MSDVTLSRKKFLAIIFGFVLIIGAVFTFSYFDIDITPKDNSVTGNIAAGSDSNTVPLTDQVSVKKSCPSECCLEGSGFQIKMCQLDYECVIGSCLPSDDDGDGLTNIEEKEIGTNTKSSDTDGDTLDDYREVRVLLTNPLNVNTDNDRYNDNLDPNPTIVNTANVVFTKFEEGDYNEFNLVKDGLIIGGLGGLGVACSGLTIGACIPIAGAAVAAALAEIKDDVIYTSTVNILFTNQGNDYTEYVRYNIVYSIGEVELIRESKTLGRLNSGISEQISHSFDIKVEDIQYGTTWDLIFGKSDIIIEIENVNYEKF